MVHRVEELQPGDYTITPVLEGFMIGRMLPQISLGAWWTFIRIVPDRATAIAATLALASDAGTRAWLQTRPGQFTRLDTQPQSEASPG